MVKTILVDCDGVIHDWVSAVLKALRPYGCSPHIQHDHIVEYYIRYQLEPELHPHLERLPYLEGFCRSIPTYPGAMAFLRALRGLGRVVALTKASAGPFWRAERHEALSGLGFADEDIAIVDRHETKYDYPGHVLIEDRADTVRAASHGTRILLDRPWNRCDRDLEAHRARDYAHALEMVK